MPTHRVHITDVQPDGNERWRVRTAEALFPGVEPISTTFFVHGVWKASLCQRAKELNVEALLDWREFGHHYRAIVRVELPGESEAA